MSLPSNISSWLKRNGSPEQQRSARKICKWCEDLGHGIVGGTAVGKYYDTLILDLTYNGGQISVYDDGTIKLNEEVVNSKRDVKAKLDEIFNKKTASYSAASLKNMAEHDVRMLGDDKEWLKHIGKEYNSFKALEGTELSKGEFETYQKECLRLLKEKRAFVNARVAKELVKIARELVAIRRPKYYHSQWASMVLKEYNEGKLDNDSEIRKWVSYQNGGAAVDSLTQEVKDILQYYKQTGIKP